MRERWWVGLAQYPGKDRFYLGTVRATGPETARAELAALWARISPHAAPEIIEAHPGRLVLEQEEEALL